MNRLRNFIKNYIPYKSIIVWGVLTILLTLLLELGNQPNFSGLTFVLDYKKIFVVNCSIVAGILSIAFLFPRKILAFSILSTSILLLGFANFAIQVFRGSPLIYLDFFSIKDGLSIIDQYISLPTLILGVIVLLLLIVGMVYLYRFKQSNYKKKMIFSALFVIVVAMARGQVIELAQRKQWVYDNTWDLVLNARENGFAYSFLRSYELSIVDEPTLYEKDTLLKIVSGEHENTSSNRPNIIFYQLESFMDPYLFENVTLSGDPIETYRMLSENFSSGSLRVPAYGGGTVRTEFEVVSGMSMQFFAPGEIPYNNIARRNVIETPAFVLQDLDYTSSYVHNFEGSFYNRNQVYSNLGFDLFISAEYMETMEELEYFPSDVHLITKIIEVLESTEDQDFIFGVGVEGHGSYWPSYVGDTSNIYVASELDYGDRQSIKFYIDELYGIDQSIKTLVDYIFSSEEDTILVLYSDHLPAFSSSEITISQEDYYLTSYVIVDNMGLEKQDQDLASYQLSSKVFEMIDLYGGKLPIFHQTYKEDTDYISYLELLQYDVSFGQYYSNNSIHPYHKSTLQFGLHPIFITSTSSTSKESIIKGEYFTYASVVFVNGKKVETTFINNNELRINEQLSKDDEVSIGQASRYDSILSMSDTYKVK